MKFLFSSVFCLFTSYLFSQLPDSDFWTLDIKDDAGKISFSNPQNITNRKGYDNQPNFSPDGKFIFYTSYNDSAKQSDIYKYEIATKKITQFTKTSTSEYSPTFTPDGKNISVVMVEKDSAQRLWKFPLDRTAPTCIMKNVNSIGYFCWLAKDNVAIHVLTKPVFTLQLANIVSQKTKIISDSIGRCIKKHGGNLWFTRKVGHFDNVYEYNLKLKKMEFKGTIESEDFCFYKNEIWSISDNTIVSGYMNDKLGAAEIVDLEPFGIKNPTRITISPDGKKLAVVSNK